MSDENQSPELNPDRVDNANCGSQTGCGCSTENPGTNPAGNDDPLADVVDTITQQPPLCHRSHEEQMNHSKLCENPIASRSYQNAKSNREKRKHQDQKIREMRPKISKSLIECGEETSQSSVTTFQTSTTYSSPNLSESDEDESTWLNLIRRNAMQTMIATTHSVLLENGFKYMGLGDDVQNIESSPVEFEDHWLSTIRDKSAISLRYSWFPDGFVLICQIIGDALKIRGFR